MLVDVRPGPANEDEHPSSCDCRGSWIQMRQHIHHYEILIQGARLNNTQQRLDLDEFCGVDRHLVLEEEGKQQHTGM
jgi:hypothetical protein